MPLLNSKVYCGIFLPFFVYPIKLTIMIDILSWIWQNMIYVICTMVWYSMLLICAVNTFFVLHDFLFNVSGSWSRMKDLSYKKPQMHFQPQMAIERPQFHSAPLTFYNNVVFQLIPTLSNNYHYKILIFNVWLNCAIA